MIRFVRSAAPRFAAASLALTLTAMLLPAQAATLTHRYEFNGNLSDTFGGPSLFSEGGTVNATSYSFAANQGLSLSNALASGGSYSIGLLFSFEATDGFRKVIDFKDRGSDTGFYIRSNTPVFYNVGVGGAPNAFPAGSMLPVVLTRDSTTMTVAAYVNGVPQFSFVDTPELGVFSAASNLMRFFRDDVPTTSEASAGVVDEIRIFDGALSAGEAARVFAPSVATVPVPSSLLLLGTGLAGLLLQRRRARN